MSERLTKALEFANYRQTLNNQIASLRSKTQTRLVLSTNGGTFTVSQELITFVNTLIEKDYNDTLTFFNVQNIPMGIVCGFGNNWIVRDIEDFDKLIRY